MRRLDSYRLAMLAAFPEVPDEQLVEAMEAGGPTFPYFVEEHGLAALWHERTGREEFRAARRLAEALYLTQEQTLKDIDSILRQAGIESAVIKGGANRLLLYDNPAIRACHDLDILVKPEDRVEAAKALYGAGFQPNFNADNISHELVLSKSRVDIDLHWALLREGRLRGDMTVEMLARRRRVGDFWVLNADDTLFLLLVHPAFAKHLSSWNMGLHRVTDVIYWLNTQSTDWHAVREQLQITGVQTAAWATLRWVKMLAQDHAPDSLDAMLADLSPGALRRGWLERWLRKDLSKRLAHNNWVRLLGLSLFLHDRPDDVIRALAGRYRASRRRETDTWAFREIVQD
jgi:hypothetical protein